MHIDIILYDEKGSLIFVLIN